MRLIDAIRAIVSMELVNRKSPLPVDVLLPEIISSLQRNRNLVVEAPPGAGKTTRVPPALLGIVGGEVVVLEPRRIAARLAARRAPGNSANRSATKSGLRKLLDRAHGCDLSPRAC
jgi:ATP-dependent helicase HrpB